MSVTREKGPYLHRTQNRGNDISCSRWTIEANALFYAQKLTKLSKLWILEKLKVENVVLNYSSLNAGNS